MKKKYISLFKILTITMGFILIYKLLSNEIIFSFLVENLKLFSEEFEIDDPSLKNYLCKQKMLKHDSKISMMYYKKSLNKENKWDEDLCQLGNSNQKQKAVLIEDLNPNGPEDFFKFQINPKFLEERPDLNSINCSIELFDKNQGKDDLNIEKLGPTLYLDLVKNKKIEISQSGFYYINCLYDNKSIYTDVLNILPKNISKKIENYSTLLEKNTKFKSNQSIPKTLYVDFDYEKCDSLFIHKKVQQKIK